MGDNHNKTKTKIQMDLAPTPVLKVEPPRNSSGPALLRTVPLTSHQTRFINTSIQASSSTSGSTINKPGNVQRIESGSGVTVMSAPVAINRLQTTTTTTPSYHVPRGAAAVANIALPRSSVATPIIRSQSNSTSHQTAFIRTSNPSVGLVNRAPSNTWLGVNTTQTPRLTQNPRQINVNSRIGSTTGTTTISTRPVLIQANPHKQLPTPVHFAEKKIVQKGAVLTSARMPNAGPGRMPRLAPPLRPVVLPAATAVLVPTPAPHSNPLQTTVVPSTVAINTRPVSVVTSTVRMASAPNQVACSAKGFCPPPETVFLQTTHKQAHGNMVSIPNNLYSVPTNSFFESSSTIFTTSAVTTTSVQARQSTSHQTGGVSTTQSIRFTNPVLMVDQPPFIPNESAQSPLQTSESSKHHTNVPAVSLKQNASPRPSILRKRDTDSVSGKAAKNLNPLFSSLSVTTPNSPPSPPSRGNNGPQSSGGSTTISATSSPGLCTDSPPLKPEEDRPVEMSPRKKPRKQQLTGNQMQEPKFSDEEMEFISSEKIKNQPREGTSHEGLAKPVAKRSSMSLIRTYRPSWKAKHLHFHRYSDLKPKEEKRPTISELCAQKNILQKANGWKIYHMENQMTGISNFEMEIYERLTAILEVVENKSGKDGEMNRINELIKGNIQRSKVISDQLQEAKCQVLKLVEHKCQVTEVLNRFMSRRSGKKRERV